MSTKPLLNLLLRVLKHIFMIHQSCPLMKRFHKFLLDRINIFINNSNNKWTEIVCYSFINTLSGSLASLYQYVKLYIEIDENIVRNTILSSLFIICL